MNGHERKQGCPYFLVFLAALAGPFFPPFFFFLRVLPYDPKRILPLFDLLSPFPISSVLSGKNTKLLVPLSSFELFLYAFYFMNRTSVPFQQNGVFLLLAEMPICLSGV